MSDVLVVVDMQQDFVTGVLGTAEAQQIVPTVVQTIREFQGSIFYTKDTHHEQYLQTQEGKFLPVVHCVEHTPGWQVQPEIEAALLEKHAVGISKETFGSMELINHLQKIDVNSITFVGVCTDICVVSNALAAKMYFPEIPIKVLATACAGSTVEKHQAALSVMESCQVISLKEGGNFWNQRKN